MELDTRNVKINIEKEFQDAVSWFEKLNDPDAKIPGNEMRGWIDLPEKNIDEICKRAQEIREKYSLLVVIGIGGSYLGTHAVNDILREKANGTRVLFAGYNISAVNLKRLIREFDKEDVALLVISKSGGTLEPMVTYSILKDRLYKKYGEEAKNRIYVITDSEKGILKKEATKEGYPTFDVPDDVGGRYSVLSPVGLLPIAVAGHDIRKLLSGASAMKQRFFEDKELLKYAAARVALLNEGKTVEVFEHFDIDLGFFVEWLKQLFGESEGKSGRGALPMRLFFSRDLHSIGQFLQEGNQVFWETVLAFEEHDVDYLIPESAGPEFEGKSIEFINKCARNGVIDAHSESGIPIISLSMQDSSEDEIGKAIYFFEVSAAISAYMQGLNPFDQLGVEKYKKEVKKYLSKQA